MSRPQLVPQVSSLRHLQPPCIQCCSACACNPPCLRGSPSALRSVVAALASPSSGPLQQQQQHSSAFTTTTLKCLYNNNTQVHLQQQHSSAFTTTTTTLKCLYNNNNNTQVPLQQHSRAFPNKQPVIYSVRHSAIHSGARTCISFANSCSLLCSPLASPDFRWLSCLIFRLSSASSLDSCFTCRSDSASSALC